MPTQSPDTHPDAERVQISMIRRESVAKRAFGMCSLSQTVRWLSRRAIKRANSALGKREGDLLFVTHLYGSDLADRLRDYLTQRNAFQCRIWQERVKYVSQNRNPNAALESDRDASMKKMEIYAALEPVAKAFDELGICYYIGGSVASSVYGMPRATQDVDLITDLKPQHANPLVAKLASAYYIDKEMILSAIDKRACFNLIHLDTMIKIDIFIAKDDAYQKKAFQRRREDTLDEENTSLKFYLLSPEDVILAKLKWFRAGGCVSEQQWRDIQGILKVQEQSLDRKYLLGWAEQLTLDELLKKSFQEAET